MKSILLFCIFLFLPLNAGAEWRSLGEGLDYRPIEGQVHLFRIDSKKIRLDLLLASDYGAAAALPAKRFRERSGAILAINGGFFDEAFRSLGLLVRRGQVINPVRMVSWGIFTLGGPEGREPGIVSRKDWRPDGVSLAIQVGPRLVIDGKIPSFKESEPSRRSAVGISPDGWVIIALSEAPLLLKEWAAVLQQECVQALNLDGGGSSQISVRIPGLSLDVEGLTNVPNALALFR